MYAPAPDRDGSYWRRTLDSGQRRAEDAWTSQAIADVVKTLKNIKGGVEDLDEALETRGYYAHCVTVPRTTTTDRYGFPTSLADPLHVMYCRTYRWPDLRSSWDDYTDSRYTQLLRSVPNCPYPYDGNTKDVCINPYHYERINNGRAGRYMYNDGYGRPGAAYTGDYEDGRGYTRSPYDGGRRQTGARDAARPAYRIW